MIYQKNTALLETLQCLLSDSDYELPKGYAWVIRYNGIYISDKHYADFWFPDSNDLDEYKRCVRIAWRNANGEYDSMEYGKYDFVG